MTIEVQTCHDCIDPYTCQADNWCDWHEHDLVIVGKLAKLFTAVGEPEPEPSQPKRSPHPDKDFIRQLGAKPKSGPAHTLSRDEYLRRKAELEAQYGFFPESRWESLNPDCYVPLVV